MHAWLAGRTYTCDLEYATDEQGHRPDLRVDSGLLFQPRLWVMEDGAMCHHCYGYYQAQHTQPCFFVERGQEALASAPSHLSIDIFDLLYSLKASDLL